MNRGVNSVSGVKKWSEVEISMCGESVSLGMVKTSRGASSGPKKGQFPSSSLPFKVAVWQKGDSVGCWKVGSAGEYQVEVLRTHNWGVIDCQVGGQNRSPLSPFG